MTIKLKAPSKTYRDEIWAYRAEFLESKESIDGSGGLQEAESFEAWYEGVCANSYAKSVREGLVPATMLLAFNNEEKLIGMIDIRHYLNDFLLAAGGHIGYSVRPDQRKKGYATQMLAQALTICKERGMKRCLLTCDRDNIASVKVIERNGGVLENEVEQEGVFIRRYWIELCAGM